MELVAPGTIKTADIDYTDVPMTYWPSASFHPGGYVTKPKEKVSAVCRSMQDCNELVKWFDNQPNFCPYLPVLLLIPGNHKLISGLGFSTAAELRDCCIEVWGVYTSSDGKKRWNVDEMREQNGMVRREDVADATREAFWERTKRHKASPITDPVKQFTYPNPTNKKKFTMPDNKEWKSSDE